MSSCQRHREYKTNTYRLKQVIKWAVVGAAAMYVAGTGCETYNNIGTGKIEINMEQAKPDGTNVDYPTIEDIINNE